MRDSIYRGVTVIQGTFLYDGTVTCDVRIVRTEVRYGSGDHEDPPAVRDDLPEPWFYIEWGSTTARGEYKAGGGGYSTLSDAMQTARKQVSGLKWDNEEP